MKHREGSFQSSSFVFAVALKCLALARETVARVAKYVKVGISGFDRRGVNKLNSVIVVVEGKDVSFGKLVWDNLGVDRIALENWHIVAVRFGESTTCTEPVMFMLGCPFVPSQDRGCRAASLVGVSA